MKKLRVAILGTGNIGTDLLIKALRSPAMECILFAGRNLSSPGMSKASGLGVPVSAKGIDAIAEHAADLDLVFDATSAQDHLKHEPVFLRHGLRAIDMTPSRVGIMCVPAVNLHECLQARNVNMVTCGGQASIPLAVALRKANPGIDYIETISSIASRSAGPATRINLDEYLSTTQEGLRRFSGAPRSKAILNLNPAQPCVHMQTTVLAWADRPDMEATRREVAAVVERMQAYIPGYNLLLGPVYENGRLAVIARVSGLGDYLPRFAGNLDIINCAAIAMAEAYATA